MFEAVLPITRRTTHTRRCERIDVGLAYRMRALRVRRQRRLATKRRRWRCRGRSSSFAASSPFSSMAASMRRLCSVIKAVGAAARFAAER